MLPLICRVFSFSEALLWRSLFTYGVALWRRTVGCELLVAGLPLWLSFYRSPFLHLKFWHLVWSSNNSQHLLSACRMPGTALKCFIWTPSNLRQPPACMWMSWGQNWERCLILGSCSNVCWKDEWPPEVGTVITSLFDKWGNRGTQRWVTFQRFLLWLEASFKHSGTQALALQLLHYTSSTLCTKSKAHIVPFNLFALSPFYRSGSQSPSEPTFDLTSVRHPNPMFSSQHHLTLLLISMLKSLCALFNWR